jgi:hypothetical protein
VYALDVAQLMGDKMPACKDSDFEQWTVPADDRTPRCLLGMLRLDLSHVSVRCLLGMLRLDLSHMRIATAPPPSRFTDWPQL